MSSDDAATLQAIDKAKAESAEYLFDHGIPTL